jgi:hypothetical protein
MVVRAQRRYRVNADPPPPNDMPNEFHLMLRRIGLNDVGITALENLGLDTVDSFHDITEKDIPSIVKELRRTCILVKQTSQNYLQALRYWVMRQERLQHNYTPNEFNDIIMRHSLQRWQASSNTADKLTEDIVKPPDDFKQNTKWRDFRESFLTFMQCTKGRCDFPLSYILREDEQPPADAEFDSQEAFEEAIVPFGGNYFDEDNRIVFDALKSRLINGPAWTWIQDFENKRDGRGAWKALQAHYEGVSGQIRMKTAAYAAIKRAEYKGAKNFDFDTYKRIHTQAHADLKRYGEPVPETKKVKDFLDGITESSLQPVKYTIAGFPNLMNNFTEAANYIGQIVDLNKKSETVTRQVATTATNGYNGRGGRGRGRHGGRFNGRGGFGRGRGRGGRGGRGRGGPGGQNIQNSNAGRWISYDNWQNMAPEEREKIRAERSAYAQKRKIDAVGTPDIDLSTADITDNDHDKKVTFADTSSAGDQMSRRKRNFIGQIRSGHRYNYSQTPRVVSVTHLEPSSSIMAKAELDSHADTTVAGSACKVIEFTEKSCDVYPYSSQYEPIKNVPIAKVATAYDHPQTGETFILIFGQALYLGDELEHTLICPNQARCNGVIVDDVPKHLSHDGKSTHSLYFPVEQIQLPLRMRGCISYLPTRYPAKDELEECRWLTVTGDSIWDPYSTTFEEQENIFDVDDGSPTTNERNHIHALSSSINLSSISHALDHTTTYLQICSMNTSSRHLSTTDQRIAHIFNCSPRIANNTRNVTTQKGIRNVTDHLNRRYRTKQAALRYNQLGGRHGRFCSDTFFSTVRSTRGNTVGQIFVNDIGYTKFIPMKAKSEAGNALVEFIQDVGIPGTLHTDNAKELNSGKWLEVCKTYDIKQTFTEPFSPFQNRAEVNIRELKKHVRQLMKRTNTPKRLWDFCASYVAEIRSLTAQPLYSLHGRTPHELVTGNTPDISEYIAGYVFLGTSKIWSAYSTYNNLSH